MSQALYRKWRPARFDDVVGQEHVTRTLRNAVAADRVGHAFLFSGPRGTGKTTSARLLAKAVNCLDPDPRQRPCDNCAACRAINEGRYLDLIEIDAASNTGVDDIRALRDRINFAPSEGRFKVYIIDEVHMLSMAAFNALLKTLEEPPPHAKFVLATTEEHKVPVTIKSRCQVFQFWLLSQEETEGRLRWLAEKEDLTLEPEALVLIARQGAGSLRDAESLLDQLVAAPGDTITLDRAQRVLGTAPVEILESLTEAWLAGDGAAGLGIIHLALAQGADVRQFARQMVAYLRDLLLLGVSDGTILLNVPAEHQEPMLALAQQAERTALLGAIKNFTEAASNTGTSWQPQLPLEMAFVESLPEAPPAAAPRRSTPVQKAASAAAPVAKTEAAEVVQEKADEVVSEGEVSPGETPPARLEPQEQHAEESSPQVAAEGDPPDRAEALTLEMVTGRWRELVNRVRQQDRNLPALLAACKPLATEGNILILAFDYPVIKEKFDNAPGAERTVEETLSQMLQLQCRVRAVVTGQYHPPSKPPVSREDFEALAQELGGVVTDSK